MDQLIQDLRYAARTLRRAPASTGVALATLALAFGLSTSIFSLVNGISLRPLPYHDPNQLVVLSSTHRESGAFSTVSGPDAADWQRGSRLLTDIALYDERSFAVRLGAEVEELTGTMTSSNVFRMLGVAPHLGRALNRADDQPGAARVVVLSHKLWRDRFDGDPAILGRSLRIEGAPYQVVGVMPEQFGFLDFGRFWIAIPAERLTDRGVREFNAMARARPGVTPDQVRQELAAINARLAIEHPATNRGWETHVGGV